MTTAAPPRGLRRLWEARRLLILHSTDDKHFSIRAQASQSPELRKELASSRPKTMQPMVQGLLSAALSYVIWGLFPLYFHTLARVDAVSIVMHRSLWCCVLVWMILFGLRRWRWLGDAARQPRIWAQFGVSALLLNSNWLLYVWAVNHGQVVEASLGYFINPLVNVLLGTFALGERPRALQWLAVGVASAGVAWLTITLGRPPWIALGLAVSFGLYGLLRKTASLGALEGLALETTFAAPVALAVLLAFGHGHVFGDLAGHEIAWLLLAGPITAVPLLLFAFGARRITMATLGTLQYLAPSIQFALGVWLYGEPLQPVRLAGFALIWGALAIYSADGFLWVRRMRMQAAG